LRDQTGEHVIEHIKQLISVQKHSEALSTLDQMDNEKQARNGSTGGFLCSKRG
jgi:hypothetical protein